MQRSTLMIIFFPPINYEVVEPNVLCLYYKFISEQIFLSEFSKSLKNSLSFSFFFFLKGISRERDRANIKITKWTRNEENFQKSIWNSHDNRAPPWQLCRVLGKRDIFTESTIIIQLHVLPRRCPVIRSTRRTSSWRISSTSNRRHPSMTFRIV